MGYVIYAQENGTMPGLNKCKGDNCKNYVRLPPNKPNATGYCRACYLARVTKHG